MYSRSKWFALAGLLVTASMILAACAPETVVETVVVPGEEVVVKETVIVEPEVEEEEVTAEGECCDVYRIGIFEDPISLNYWNYLGPGSSVWTAYVVTGSQAALYGLSDQRWDFVPSLAKDFATVEQVGDVWTVTVEMVENAMWSDGESIDAHDVVFTQNACSDLQLTSNWPNQCWPSVHTKTEALDDYTVQFTFIEEPSLGTWQAGVALAPILPQHFWADTMAASYAFIEGLEEPTDDCTVEEPSEACVAYAEAFENARKNLYEADAAGQPSAGGYITEKWELGAFAQRVANDNYFFKGARVVEYDDGTWMLTLPDGTTWQAYGDATGE
jgi:ABC-type transport system substrate-binding protein